MIFSRVRSPILRDTSSFPPWSKPAATRAKRQCGWERPNGSSRTAYENTGSISEGFAKGMIETKDKKHELPARGLWRIGIVPPPRVAHSATLVVYKILSGQRRRRRGGPDAGPRLIENITLGSAAAGYLAESMHGAGSPQAQRIIISRPADLKGRQKKARKLCGIITESIS